MSRTTETGRLVKEDVGSGVWVLETDDGRRVMLDGHVPGHLAGQRVRVDGEGGGDSMGIGMVSDAMIKVKRIDKA